MKRTTLHGMYAVLLVTWAVFAYNTLSVNSQSAADAATIGTVRLTQAVLADGKPLAAARIRSDSPTTSRRPPSASHPGPSVGSSSSQTARSQGARSQP